MRTKLDYPIRGDSKNKVCVFMMAANEQAVIKKCLDSLKPIAGMIVFQNNSPNPDSTCSIVENIMPIVKKDRIVFKSKSSSNILLEVSNAN